ncbi:hypothetical protein BpHYR1_012010, partial [Brachionus plicatilis]
ITEIKIFRYGGRYFLNGSGKFGKILLFSRARFIRKSSYFYLLKKEKAKKSTDRCIRRLEQYFDYLEYYGMNFDEKCEFCNLDLNNSLFITIRKFYYFYIHLEQMNHFLTQSEQTKKITLEF